MRKDIPRLRRGISKANARQLLRVHEEIKPIFRNSSDVESEGFWCSVTGARLRLSNQTGDEVGVHIGVGGQGFGWIVENVVI